MASSDRRRDLVSLGPGLEGPGVLHVGLDHALDVDEEIAAEVSCETRFINRPQDESRTPKTPSSSADLSRCHHRQYRLRWFPEGPRRSATDLTLELQVITRACCLRDRDQRSPETSVMGSIVDDRGDIDDLTGEGSRERSLPVSPSAGKT